MTSKKNGWLSAPYLVWITGFIVLPLCTIIYYAFTSKAGGFTFDNILGAITSDTNLKALGLSVLFSVLTTAICFALAYPLALCLSKLKLKRKSFLVFLFILPMWMNFMLQMVAIRVILEDNGILNMFLTSLGFDALSIANSPAAILIGMVYDYFPFMLLPIYNAVSRIDNSLINASKDLGANSFITFTRVIFPLSLPGIVSGITMVFVPTISDFAIADMLGGSKILLIGNVIESNFTRGQYYQGSGLAVLLMIFVILTSLVAGGGKDDEGSVLMP